MNNIEQECPNCKMSLRDILSQAIAQAEERGKMKGIELAHDSCIQEGRNQMKAKCLACVPEEKTVREWTGTDDKDSPRYKIGHNSCRSQTIKNIEELQ